MTNKFKGNDDKLTSKDIDKLKELITIIVNNLSCDISFREFEDSCDEEEDDGFPCLTCRIDSLDAMKQFLEIHDYKVVDTSESC